MNNSRQQHPPQRKQDAYQANKSTHYNNNKGSININQSSSSSSQQQYNYIQREQQYRTQQEEHYKHQEKYSNNYSTPSSSSKLDRKPIKARSHRLLMTNQPPPQDSNHGSTKQHQNYQSHAPPSSQHYGRSRTNHYHHQFQQQYEEGNDKTKANPHHGKYYHQFNRGPNQVLSHRKSQYEKYEWPDKLSNPHCEQILHYNDPHIESKDFERENRILQHDAAQEPYRRRRDELKSVVHWGQRKLLMSEIEFLTEFGYPGAIVVYAGAAPGHHTNFLSDLFPDLSFVLVDPCPFVCTPTEKITIINDYFTDELAEKYADKNVLFISDIRTAQPEKGNDNQTKEHRDEVERCVKWDNQAQMNWHRMIKPKMSMLKFRLPYDTASEKTYEYLKGDVYLPVWGPQTTTETRLVCSGNCETILYDTQKYESQMFYFNTRTRVHYFPHKVQVEGMDHCYDCRAEVYILDQYLKKYKKIENESELLTQIASLSNLVSRNCTTALGARIHTLATYEKNFRKDEVKKNLASIYETDRIKLNKGENKRTKEESIDDLKQKVIKRTRRLNFRIKKRRTIFTQLFDFFW